MADTTWSLKYDKKKCAAATAAAQIRTFIVASCSTLITASLVYLPFFSPYTLSKSISPKLEKKEGGVIHSFIRNKIVDIIIIFFEKKKPLGVLGRLRVKRV